MPNLAQGPEFQSAPAARSSNRASTELLAPAGDRECLHAAIENGADAIYFGLQGHNARARASNFKIDELGEIMATLHRRGVRGYVTLNTLVFPEEIGEIERIVREVAAAGVDAVIAQDLGLCKLIRSITADLEIHASTQMSITSASGVRLARELGCSRVILARELSLVEIERIGRVSELPLEVFVHGALCVAYSGQCLTSEALGGRSANRGECAQACRLPYEIVRDGETVDLDATKFLLSPKDLAAFELVPKLVDLGIASLKIEGRLKTPEYVANITSHYRRALDAALAGKPAHWTRRDIDEMELSFSRGFSRGFFDGNNHKTLVRGDYSKKRGLRLGEVVSVTDRYAIVELNSAIKPGDGIVFDGDESLGIDEQGGRVYEVLRPGPKGTFQRVSGELAEGKAALGFGRGDVDLQSLRIGRTVWKTDDPELTRKLRKTFSGPPRRSLKINTHLYAHVGKRLILEGVAADGRRARVEGIEPLERALNRPATVETLRDQIDRLGGTGYAIGEFSADIAGDPLVPSSVLNALRRSWIARFDELARIPRERAIAAEPVAPALKSRIGDSKESYVNTPVNDPEISVLCRTVDQAEAAVDCGVSWIYLDFQDITRYAEAIARLRDRGSIRVFPATPRIEKPGEAGMFGRVARSGGDGILVRNAGGLYFCASEAIPFVADFSLNAANELSVDLLHKAGAERVTASYDLNIDQLYELVKSSRRNVLEIVIHQHVPMFHMEHCVFCAVLSPGTDKTNCGRPCDFHEVKLRDRVGLEHSLKADVGCRNTLFHASPQTAAEYLPELIARGADRFRVELLDDDSRSTKRTLTLYREVIAGRRDLKSLRRELGAINEYGVTRGSLAPPPPSEPVSIRPLVTKKS